MDTEDNIHKLGGLHKTEIELLIEGLRARITALEKVVCANGRPGLEDRMVTRIMNEIGTLRSYVDARDEHKQNSFSQAMMNITNLFERLASKQDERHEQNQAKFNGISVKIAYASGAFAVIVVLVQHFWK